MSSRSILTLFNFISPPFPYLKQMWKVSEALFFLKYRCFTTRSAQSHFVGLRALQMARWKALCFANGCSSLTPSDKTQTMGVYAFGIPGIAVITQSLQTADNAGSDTPHDKSP